MESINASKNNENFFNFSLLDHQTHAYSDYEFRLNSTENDTFLLDSQYNLPIWRQVFWTILYIIMITLATGGNLIVIWIVLAHKRMRSVTNYFLVNLSIADAMVSTLNVTFNFFFMLKGHWPFGEFYCKVAQSVAVLSISASVFTMMAISIDRYTAIMNPLKPRMGRVTTIVITAVIWSFSTVISLPFFFYYTTYVIDLPDQDYRVICYAEWPDGPSPISYVEYWYNVIFTILTYVIPITSMTYTYSKIGLELWGSRSIGESTQRQVDNIKNKRRVVKMMIVVVMIFGICWLPYHLYFIVIAYYPEITNVKHIQEIYLAIYWLAMSNSMYNPMIYCWMNSRFRRGFKQFFSWCPFISVNPEPFLRREVYTSRYTIAGNAELRRLTRRGSSHSHCNLTESMKVTTSAISRRTNGHLDTDATS